MGHGPATHVPPNEEQRTLDAGFRLVVVMAGICLLLVVVLALGGLFGGRGARGVAEGGPTGSAAISPTASIDVAAYLEPVVRDAPPIDLIDPDGNPLTLASLRGGLVLVFFGYTNCPDVCPATTGIVSTVMADFGPGVRTLFVTVDPERDTPAWLKEYVRYVPAALTALTGSPSEIRTTADAWGVRYARVETGVPGAYSMSHTADVYVVDAAGGLRARFPFGTTADAMIATLRAIAGTAGTSPSAVAPASSLPAPIATPSAAALGALRVEVVSSSVWAGGSSPVILALSGPAGRLDDPSLHPSVQLMREDGSAAGGPVEAIAVRPPGIDAVSYVAVLDVPSPGSWRLAVSATPGAITLAGTADVTVLDQGASARLGSPAPTIRTPTLDDVTGDARQLTTDPLPDLRLYRHSTSDALAGHDPFVLVLDSTKFRVTTACGKALIMARFLQDRWPDVAFIHHEPFRYSVVTDTPVLQGTLTEPYLTDVADAWGMGGEPWGALSMPWVFVVDGNGIVRAKYQGIIGSDDIDVIVALIAQEG